jgi:CDP-glucose 4,6-dehydratase
VADRNCALEGVGLTDTWNGRRVLVTGHTGFKGAWLSAWLDHLGAHLHGLALPPTHRDGAWPALGPPALVEHMADLRDKASVEACVRAAAPEVILHLAAQALVGRGHRDPVQTFEVNVAGTVNLLDAIERLPDRPTAVVVVTSDKVYRNAGSGRPFQESDALGGGDPYSASKAATEMVVAAYRNRGLPVVTARAGNVIGGGDRGRDRLIPDVLESVRRGQPVILRNPAGVRPWQYVLDPLEGYLRYAGALLEQQDVPPALNFGPIDDRPVTVCEVVEALLSLCGRGSWRPSSSRPLPEAASLRLDASAATAALCWRQRYDLNEALRRTVAWDTAHSEGLDMRRLARAEFDAHLAGAA